MQRSFTYQDALIALLSAAFFAAYSAIGSIYLFLPPLFAVVGYLFYRTLERHELGMLIIILFFLLMIEAERGFWFGSSVLYFTLLSRYAMPKLLQNMRCEWCIKGLFVFFAYMGYWIFMKIINSVLLLNPPMLDWHIVFYMLIEFALIAVIL
jgi:membrane-associated HD superfamily phosphohydrolase